VSAVRAEIQLGPGKVKSAVLTMRFDLPRLGLSADDRETVLEAVVGAVDRASARLDEGPEALAAAYTERCPIVGQRVKLKLRPKGETRGRARSVDRLARLELESATGMVERIGVDQMADLQVV
jgi:biotin-(acetyl-CoA carboxylase) ligase